MKPVHGLRRYLLSTGAIRETVKSGIADEEPTPEVLYYAIFCQGVLRLDYLAIRSLAEEFGISLSEARRRFLRVS